MTVQFGSYKNVLAPLILILLAAVLFGKFLYDPGWVLSDFGKDGSTFFYHRLLLAREGFAHGSPTPWNPYSGCGVPALATFQYVTLYPPHWLASWLLPLPLAINWLMFSHVCLTGLGMFGWLRFRGLRPAAAALAGVVFMLCGPCFAMRPVAGYVHTMSLAWIPLVFWGIDGWLRRRECRWLALAAGAAAAQIYAGYVPCFYFTALAAGFYALTELFFAEKKMSAAAGLLAVYPLAFALAAAQLLPGLMLAGESVRAGGIDTAGAAHGSLRWENLPLLVSPYLYGGRVWLEEGARALRWWGNEYPYFGIPFVGLGALLLAVVGLAGGRRPRNAGLVALALLALVVALGPRTPLAGWLREWLPGFAGLRMMGMMLVFFALPVALLAGAGASVLLCGETAAPRWLSLSAAAFGLALTVTGLWLWTGGGSEVFREWMGRVMDAPGYRHPDTAEWWARAAAGGGAELLLAGCWLLAFGALMLFVKNLGKLGWALAALTVIELFCFARPLMRGFRAEWLAYPEIRNFFAAHPGDERHLNLVNKDSAPLFGRESIWGFEELALRRYGDLLAVSQNLPPEQARGVEVRQNSRIFRLLRARWAFVPGRGGIQVVELQKDLLPRFLVVKNWRVMTRRDEILRTLSAPDFDFRREVILETTPDLPPAPAAGMVPTPEYKINVLSSSATHWEVEIETGAPGVLLMTDAYAKGWRARARPGSAQQTYNLQPADWAVRGIPLAVAGTHRIEITYTAPGLAAGLWITSLTLLLAGGTACVIHFRRMSQRF